MNSGRWELCPTCQQIRFTGSVMEHECPVLVRSLKEDQMAELASEIMYDFNKDLDKFWKDPKVKFMQHLAEEGEI